MHSVIRYSSFFFNNLNYDLTYLYYIDDKFLYFNNFFKCDFTLPFNLKGYSVFFYFKNTKCDLDIDQFLFYSVSKRLFSYNFYNNYFANNYYKNYMKFIMFFNNCVLTSLNKLNIAKKVVVKYKKKYKMFRYVKVRKKSRKRFKHIFKEKVKYSSIYFMYCNEILLNFFNFYDLAFYNLSRFIYNYKNFMANYKIVTKFYGWVQAKCYNYISDDKEGKRKIIVFVSFYNVLVLMLNKFSKILDPSYYDFSIAVYKLRVLLNILKELRFHIFFHMCGIDDSRNFFDFSLVYLCRRFF